MPTTPTYPGVYIEELESAVRPIVGVATSVTAFLGPARWGEVNRATTITSWGDFERRFGGLWSGSPMSYAVRDFYNNGGTTAVIVRLWTASEDENGEDETGDVPVEAPGAPVGTATASSGSLQLAAASPGSWGNHLRAFVVIQEPPGEGASDDTEGDDTEGEDTEGEGTEGEGTDGGETEGEGTDGGETEGEGTDGGETEGEDAPTVFDLYLRDEGTGRTEQHLGLSSAADEPNSADVVLERMSGLARVITLGAPEASEVYWPLYEDDGVTPKRDGGGIEYEEDARPDLPLGFEPFGGPLDDKGTPLHPDPAVFEGGAESGPVDLQAYYGSEVDSEGLYALTTDAVDIFNIVCLPPPSWESDQPPRLWDVAASFCKRHRAFLIVDPPAAWDGGQVGLDEVIGGADWVSEADDHAALYFPRIRRRDADGIERSFAPCGAIAGVMARTDAERGVWKAPAGLDAGLTDVPSLTRVLNDRENGLLNPRAVNVIRPKPAAGRVVWGARTLDGDDREASQWKYIPVRRLALFIEESLYRGTQWAVFEPNDEPLWGSLRLNIGAFMHRLFRQGAFQGSKPRDAYSVAVDSTTTTQADIDLGIVNIVVGFAPLKPAEFVIIQIRQLAGQTGA